MANRFRKVFIICEDNAIFPKLEQITVFKYRDHAEFRMKYLERKAKEERTQNYMKNEPTVKFKVHGFYLVHEDLFRE